MSDVILVDADIAAQYDGRVYVSSHGYARLTDTDEYLHRVILGVRSRRVRVDHINRNKLDNRRANLRKATHAQNICNSRFRSNNTSGYRGVYFCKQTKRWRAQIRANGRTRQLGRFPTAEAAARAYDAAARKLHGKFAVPNA